VKFKIQLLSLIIIIAFISSCDPQRKDNLSDLELNLRIDKATLFYQIGEYEKANRLLDELTGNPDLNKFKKERTVIYYSLACNYALLGDDEKALSYLNKAIEYGYANFRHIANDDDLRNIRENKKFIQIIDDLKRSQSLWDNSFIETPYRDNISEDEKIAGLSKLWSEIKFNFINFDLVPDVNPDSLYMEFLPKVRATTSTLEYYKLLQNFCVQFNDGHTEVDFPKELRGVIRGRVPIQTRLVEGKVIITKVYDEKLTLKGIQPGIEITNVDGFEVKEYAEKFIIPYWTTNSPHGRDRTIYEYAFLRGQVNKPVKIKCKNSAGEIFNVMLPRLKRIPVKWEPVVYRPLQNNIGYVNIKSFYDDEIVALFDSVFTQIKETDGLIIDLRENGGGNGRVGWNILGYFTNKPFQIFKWKSRLYRPIWRAWGRSEEMYEEKPVMKMADEKKYYSKSVVVLTRDRTASMAENFCVGFKILNRGKIVGGPTMGSSGTPLAFPLPGGGRAKVVTTRSTYPDGEEFIGIGVKPDIEVYPTIEDFRIGKDRILDEAKGYLEKIISSN